MPDMITKNFSINALACRCCKAQGIDGHLVRKLQAVRDRYKKPIYISSGFRCPSHNIAEGGSPTSSHLTGKAADIAIISSRDRYKLLPFLLAEFERIGIGADFIHVDIDEGKSKELAWLY